MEKCASATIAGNSSVCDTALFASCNSTFQARYHSESAAAPESWLPWNPSSPCEDQWEYFAQLEMTSSAQPQGVIDTLRVTSSIAARSSSLDTWSSSTSRCAQEAAQEALEGHRGTQEGPPSDRSLLHGNEVPPPQTNSGVPAKLQNALEHFFPGELSRAYKTKSLGALKTGPYISIFLSAVLMVPGIFMIVNGWDDLNTDLGASWAPIGLILVGMSAIVLWFSLIRLRAAFTVVAAGDLSAVKTQAMLYCSMCGHRGMDGIETATSANERL